MNFHFLPFLFSAVIVWANPSEITAYEVELCRGRHLPFTTESGTLFACPNLFPKRIAVPDANSTAENLRDLRTEITLLKQRIAALEASCKN